MKQRIDVIFNRPAQAKCILNPYKLSSGDRSSIRFEQITEVVCGRLELCCGDREHAMEDFA